MFKKKVMPSTIDKKNPLLSKNEIIVKGDSVLNKILIERDKELRPFNRIIFGSIFINTLTALIVVLSLTL